MNDLDTINNLEALLLNNESEKELPYRNSFLETNEEMLLDDCVYREMHYTKYNHAVRTRNNS